MNENCEIDRSLLKDIGNIVIDTKLPKEERMKSFIEQIGNPYCYLDNGIVVQISYADTPVSLEERLASYACGIGVYGNLLHNR